MKNIIKTPVKDIIKQETGRQTAAIKQLKNNFDSKRSMFGPIGTPKSVRSVYNDDSWVISFV